MAARRVSDPEANLAPRAVLPDGSAVIADPFNPGVQHDLVLVSLDGSRKTTTLLATAADERRPRRLAG